MPKGRRRFYEDAALRQQERLKRPVIWFPYPVLISFALCLLFTEAITTGLNPRIGNPATILTFEAEEEQAGSIWISVTPINDNIVVTTDTKQVYKWPLKPKEEAIKPLIDFLRQRVFEDTLTSALAKKVTVTQTRVVMACDRQLTYAHLRPLLSALGKAGITNFAIEALMPPHKTDHARETKRF